MKRVRRTYKDIKEYVEAFEHELISNEDDIVELNGYVKAKTKLTIKCEKGHIFRTSFDVYKNGKFKCKKCVYESGNLRRKYTFEDVKKYFLEENYNVISLKSEYKNMESVLKVICPNGHKWTSSYNNFKAGYKCPYCKIINKEKKDREELEQILINHGYEILDFKRNPDDFFSESLFTVKCENGHIFNKSIKSIRSGKLTCIDCFGKTKKDLDEVIDTFEKYGYSVISHNGYKNNQSRFTIKCENGHVRDISFATFQQSNYKNCILCANDKKRISLGERIIADYLDRKNINYVYQYKIEECRLKAELPFDFYLPDYNLLIEFDGEQHYKPIKHFGGLEKFISRKIGDTVKNIFCKDNIPLLRIPYWELDNIENILEEEIIHYGKSSTTIP